MLTAPAQRLYATVTVSGKGEAETELSLPYRGERLRGDASLRRLEAWARDGVIEPSCADAVRTVADHPEWLRLPGRTIAVLGAGAEVGPLPALLSWGAGVIAVDLPRPSIWERLLDTARRSAGTLLVPVAHDNAGQRWDSRACTERGARQQPQSRPGHGARTPCAGLHADRPQFAQPVSLHSFRGKVVLLAFNDSECTTICPLTTAAMLDARAMLGAAGSRVQLLGVDANPKATSLEDVLSYSQLHGMLHSWRFLTGSLGQLERVWAAYKVQAAIQGGEIRPTPRRCS